jgi:hypothetical protein
MFLQHEDSRAAAWDYAKTYTEVLRRQSLVSWFWVRVKPARAGGFDLHLYPRPGKRAPDYVLTAFEQRIQRLNSITRQ